MLLLYDDNSADWCAASGVELPSTLLLTREEALRLLREHGIAGRCFLDRLHTVQLARKAVAMGRRYYIRRQLADLIRCQITCGDAAFALMYEEMMDQKP